MMHGIIAKAEKSKSGKSLRIQVNGKWYSTNNWALEQAIGRNVQFEVGTSEYMGNTIFWANDAELVEQTAPVQPPTGAASQPSTAAPNQSVASPDGMAFLPFTSNQVAHAIAAGLITKPEDIYPWAQKAFHTAKSLVSGIDTFDGTPPTEDFDDDIPF
jgi:hypothetical protein